MASTLRVKLVGADPEIDKLEVVVSKFSLSCTRAKDTEDACESQETQSADLFILGASEFSQAHINQIQKLSPSPEIFLATGKKVPNLAKVMAASLLYVDWKEDEIAWQLEQAVSLYRRKRRLTALRDHRNRSWNIETNPAINLVTNVMRRCATAEQYSDILSALLTLRTVVDFHDSALVTLGENGEVLEAWRHSKEMRDNIEKITATPAVLQDCLTSLGDGKVALFSSAESAHASWER